MSSDDLAFMLDCSSSEDHSADGFEFVELPYRLRLSEYQPYYLVAGYMDAGFNRKGDEYDVDFESVYFDLSVCTGADNRCTAIQGPSSPSDGLKWRRA